MQPSTATDTPDRPVVHSNRGGHGGWPGWLSRVNNANLIHSMSSKARSPDDVACEGFFSCPKNELFYPRDWKGTTIEQFIEVVDSHIRLYNEKRIKISLGSLSPIEYGQALDLQHRPVQVYPHPRWVRFVWKSTPSVPTG
ncbi:hypothetical protein GmRootA79_37850 [Acidovorax sp. A79]